MKHLPPIIALLTSPALAHPGDHREAGLLHLVTEPDHLTLLALSAAIVVYGLARFRSRR